MNALAEGSLFFNKCVKQLRVDNHMNLPVTYQKNYIQDQQGKQRYCVFNQPYLTGALVLIGPCIYLAVSHFVE